MDKLIIPYPDFQMGELIDPEQHDINNRYIVNKANEFVDTLNVINSNGGANAVGLTPPAPFTSVTVQTLFNELVARLNNPNATTSGASLIATPTLVKLAGNSVEAQLKALDTLLQSAHVATGNIANGAVTTEKIADSNVTTGKLANASVTTDKLANASVTTAKLALGSVTTPILADGSVTTPKVLDGNITTAKLADGSVTTAKVADATIATPKVIDGSITTPKLASNSVSSDKIQDGAIGETKIPTGTIATNHIKDSSVTASKISDRSITSTKIGSQAIKEEHLDPILLNSLPQTLLSAKVQTLENEMDVAQLELFNQDARLDTTELDITTLKTNSRPIATQAEAKAGTNNTKDMTPLRVSDVTGILTSLTTTNKTNLVSAVNEVNAKTQTATAPEAIAGLDNAKLMTPLLTKFANTVAIMGDGEDLDTTLVPFVIKNIGGTYYYVETKFYDTFGGSQKVQTRWTYSGYPDIQIRNCYMNNWSDWSPSVQDLKQSGVNAKNSVVTAINAKGVGVTTNDSWATVASAIGQIQTNSTATGTFTLGTKKTIYPDSSVKGLTQPNFISINVGFSPTYLILRKTPDVSNFPIGFIRSNSENEEQYGVVLQQGVSWPNRLNDVYMDFTVANGSTVQINGYTVYNTTSYADSIEFPEGTYQYIAIK